MTLEMRRALSKRPPPSLYIIRLLKNPLSPRLLKEVQMQGGARKAE